jgi:hypothetical protein
MEQYSPIYFEFPLAGLVITDESDTVAIEFVFFNLALNSSLILNNTQIFAKLDEHPVGNLTSEMMFSPKIEEYKFEGKLLKKLSFYLQFSFPVNVSNHKSLNLMIDNNIESASFEVSSFFSLFISLTF